MGGGGICHGDTKTLEMIRDTRIIYTLPPSFSVASVSPW
jgi:hypothetical protein